MLANLSKPKRNSQSIIFTVALVCLLTGTGVNANNINVKNVMLTGQNTTTKKTKVQFDISWEKSWRLDPGTAPGNWDAAWVFVKFRCPAYSSGDGYSDGSDPTLIKVASTAGLRVGMVVSVQAGGQGKFQDLTLVTQIIDDQNFRVDIDPASRLGGTDVVLGERMWEHAKLTNITSTPSGSAITLGLMKPESTYDINGNPAMGVFISRSAIGSGSNDWRHVLLEWNYGFGDVSVLDAAKVEIQVYAIEMVHITVGSYQLGDKQSGTSGIFNFQSGQSYYQIDSEGPLVVDYSFGISFNNTSDYTGYMGGAIPQDFPKGFDAFYCMKYEISQMEYVDFLNSLTQVQADARSGPSAYNGMYRNQIAGNAIDSYKTAFSYVAANYLTWTDVAAFLDWSCLRPMTEMEYEKVCRGPEPSMSQCFAWGTSALNYNVYNGLNSPGSTSETVMNPGTVNVAWSTTMTTIGGPLRVGVFANDVSTRLESGSSYYGVMEMSGNVWEPAVTIGNLAGLSFIKVLGDGTLNVKGQSTVDTWPGIGGNNNLMAPNGGYDGVTGVTGTAGIGYRGGDWSTTSANRLFISDRTFAASIEPAIIGIQCLGGRGVRQYY